MMKQLVLLAVFMCLVSAYTVVVIPNPANASKSITAVPTPTNDSSFYYSYLFYDETGTLQAYSNNSSYTIPSTFNGTRIYAAIKSNLTPSDIASNYTLVFSTFEVSVGTSFLQSQTGDFFSQYASIVVGILSIAMGYKFGTKLSDKALTACISSMAGYLVLYFAFTPPISAPILLYGSIALLIVGLLLRRANI